MKYIKTYENRYYKGSKSELENGILQKKMYIK
jgi:hypothetical protein